MDIELKDTLVRADSKGMLAELIDADEAQKHNDKFGHLFLVSFTGKKTARGNHYHKKKHEYYMVISGTVKVILVDIKTLEKKKIILSAEKEKLQCLRIGPNVAHACYGSPRARMVVYFSDPYKEDKDTYEYIVINNKK